MRFILFWCIWYHLVALQNSVQNGLKWCKSSCHEVVSDFATNAPDPPYWTLTSSFGVFHTIWVYLGQFGCITKLSAKWAKLVQKFVPRSRVGIFRNERTRSTPLDTKVTFVCVLYYLDAFETVWLHYITQCKTGRTGAKVRAAKSHLNFSKQTYLIDPVGT